MAEMLANTLKTKASKHPKHGRQGQDGESVRNSKWGTTNAEQEFKYGSQSDRCLPESGPGFVSVRAPPPPANTDNNKRKCGLGPR